LALYRELLTHVEGRSVALEEFARQMIYAEEMHAADVDKMLRRPGEVAAFSAGAALGGLSIYKLPYFRHPTQHIDQRHLFGRLAFDRHQARIGDDDG